jgi:cell division transport system ATP-binding protein
MAQIEFKNITKKYNKDPEVLNNVSFSVNDDEFVFIVGPSGAGKSTLVKLLIREEYPNEGDILFKGESILAIPQEDICSLRRKIGVVFQDFKLLNSKNVFDNVAVALDVVDAPKGVIREVIPNVLGMVGLSNKIYSMPDQLSGGEKQRVAIARALAHEPDVLIADEPTGNIDPKSADELIDILEKINSLGTTIIMATHDFHIVDKLKKRVIRIENGEIKSDKQKGAYNV